MKREFYIDTPLGKLRVWAKHDVDSAPDFPGVNIDLVDEKNGDIIVAVVEYDSVDRNIQTCVYGDVDREEPTEIVRLENYNRVENSLYRVTISEVLKKEVLIYEKSFEDAIAEAESLYDAQEIVLTADDYSHHNVEAELYSPSPYDNEYGDLPVYGNPYYEENVDEPDAGEKEAEPELTGEEAIKALYDLLDYSKDMERENESHYGPKNTDNPWYNDRRVVEWAIKKLKGLNNDDL